MDETTPPTNSEVPGFATQSSRDAGSSQITPGQPVLKRTLKRPPKNTNGWIIWLVLPLVFLVGIGSGWLIWGQKASGANTDTSVTIKDDVKRYTVPVDGDPSQGPEDAPITIIEFSDYQCPYCTRWYDEVYSRLMKDYKGKVRFVYRDFPLYSLHPEAQPAAEAANCAGEQNAYWQYHDALFGQKSGLGSDAYLKYAQDLNLNMDKFVQCVKEHRYKDEVEADYKFASNLGVSSTPTFFVNGLAVVGAQPYDVFKQVIDKELAGEIPK